MHQNFEDVAARGLLSPDGTQMENHHHFHAPSLYHPAAGILSGPSVPAYPINTHLQQIPPFNPPSSPVGPGAYHREVHAPSFSELSTRLEGLQQQHFQAPSHSLFQASRTVNGPHQKKRQRESDDEDGEEAVSRLRSRWPPAAPPPPQPTPSPQASNGSTDVSAIEEDGTDRDFNGPFIREMYKQRPQDFEE